MALKVAPLRVAVDATPLLGQRTGIGVALDGFLRCLSGRAELDVRGYAFTLRGWRGLAGQLPAGMRAVARPAPAAALLRAWARWDFPSGRWLTGPVDVVHGANFVVPPSHAVRIVSVWDMTAVRYPELCTRTSRLYPQLVARAVAGGAWVHTGAESVAEEVCSHYGVPRSRVRVVAPAVMPAMPLSSAFPAPPPSGPDGAPSGRPYILGLGRTEPRKEFPTLVAAFDRVAELQPEVELRIAGPPGWGEDEVAAAIARSPYRNRIRREGWVADATALVAGARVFAYPSRYEGFGLPPLEAMALGVPVVATAVGALPEVVAGAAEMVQPGDVDGLAQALERVLTDEHRRAELIRAGTGRVARFSPEQTARGLIRMYQDAAGRS